MSKHAAAAESCGFKAFDDHVIVEFAAKEKTPGGLFVPGNVSLEEPTGIVRSVGEGHQTWQGERVPLAVKVGDEVIVNKANAICSLNGKHGEKLMIFKSTEVLAKVEK